MIRCDHKGCRAVTSYAKVGVDRRGNDILVPNQFGGEPDWASHIVDGLGYCGWHVDEARTALAAKLGIDQAFADRVVVEGYLVAQSGRIFVKGGRGVHDGWTLQNPHRPTSKEPERKDPWNDAEHAEHLALIAHEVSALAMGKHVTAITDPEEMAAHHRRQAAAKAG